jgi:hypothetical protein
VANAVAVVAPRVYIVDDEPGDGHGLDSAPGRFRAAGEHGFTSSAASGCYGKGFVFGLGPARGEWTVHVEARGRYEVFARWPRGHWTTVAEYTLVGLTEPVVVRVSQVGGAGEWFPLGFVEADAETPIRVEVTSCTRDPVAADAIRVVERGDRFSPRRRRRRGEMRSLPVDGSATVKDRCVIDAGFELDLNSWDSFPANNRKGSHLDAAAIAAASRNDPRPVKPPYGFPSPPTRLLASAA